jgi:hypothetical protein
VPEGTSRKLPVAIRKVMGNLRFPLDKTYHGCPQNLGVAYIRAMTALDSLKLENDQQFGVNVIKASLKAPIRQMKTQGSMPRSYLTRSRTALMPLDTTQPMMNMSI